MGKCKCIWANAYGQMHMGKWTNEELSWLLEFQNLAWTAMFWPPRSLLSKFLFLLMHLFWKATIFQKIPSTVANTHFVLEQGSVLWVGYFKTIGSQAKQRKKKRRFLKFIDGLATPSTVWSTACWWELAVAGEGSPWREVWSLETGWSSQYWSVFV